MMMAGKAQSKPSIVKPRQAATEANTALIYNTSHTRARTRTHRHDRDVHEANRPICSSSSSSALAKSVHIFRESPIRGWRVALRSQRAVLGAIPKNEDKIPPKNKSGVSD